MNEHIDKAFSSAEEWILEAEERYKKGDLGRAEIAVKLAQAHTDKALAHRVDVLTSLVGEFFMRHYGEKK